mgnify:CR=1 FL=1
MEYSIITPVYNRSDCIERCMKSVSNAIEHLKETYKDIYIEHVIVDDGSSDSTASIIKTYAYTHPHIKFLRFEHNKGTNAARNAAINIASGKWCIILDSDDYFCETALIDITNTIENNNQYKHYVFSPDDMLPFYNTNPLLKGCKQKILTYQDFLEGKISFDFIHVIQKETLLKYPFDETLRIYEGVFFLLFYREALKILFTNKIVTIRERNRKDSVSLETIRTNTAVIKRSIKSNELKLFYFQNDMTSLGLRKKLHNIRLTLLENYILLEQYNQANALIKQMGKSQSSKEHFLRISCKLHLGILIRLLLKSYLYIKYKLLKKDMKVK